MSYLSCAIEKSSVMLINAYCVFASVVIASPMASNASNTSFGNWYEFKWIIEISFLLLSDGGRGSP
jgi:hypothetical protein